MARAVKNGSREPRKGATTRGVRHQRAAVPPPSASGTRKARGVNRIGKSANVTTPHEKHLRRRAAVDAAYAL